MMVRYEDELPVTARQLSDWGRIPLNYLSKILRVLVRADLLTAHRGVGGGFRFARSPAQITIMDIVAPFEDVDRDPICPFGQASCSDDNPCSLHERWEAMRRQFLDALRTVDLRSAVPAGPVTRTTSKRAAKGTSTPRGLNRR